MGGTEGQEGWGVLGRAESTFKGPEVGKASVCWRDRNDADKCANVEPVAWSNFLKPAPLEGGESGCAPCPRCRAPQLAVSGVCLGEEVRMDHLSGLGRLAGTAACMCSVYS